MILELCPQTSHHQPRNLHHLALVLQFLVPNLLQLALDLQLKAPSLHKQIQNLHRLARIKMKILKLGKYFLTNF